MGAMTFRLKSREVLVRQQADLDPDRAHRRDFFRDGPHSDRIWKDEQRGILADTAWCVGDCVEHMTTEELLERYDPACDEARWRIDAVQEAQRQRDQKLERIRALEAELAALKAQL